MLGAAPTVPAHTPIVTLASTHSIVSNTLLHHRIEFQHLPQLPSCCHAESLGTDMRTLRSSPPITHSTHTYMPSCMPICLHFCHACLYGMYTCRHTTQCMAYMCQCFVCVCMCVQSACSMHAYVHLRHTCKEVIIQECIKIPC